MDTTVSGVVGFKVVADQYKKAEVYTFAFFVIQFPCKALGQPGLGNRFGAKDHECFKVISFIYILLPKYIYLVQCDFFARAT